MNKQKGLIILIILLLIDLGLIGGIVYTVFATQEDTKIYDENKTSVAPELDQHEVSKDRSKDRLEMIEMIEENFLMFTPVSAIEENEWRIDHFAFIGDKEFYVDYNDHEYAYRVLVECEELDPYQCQINGFYVPDLKEAVWKLETGASIDEEISEWYIRKLGEWYPVIDSRDVYYFPVNYQDIKKYKAHDPEMAWLEDPVEVVEHNFPSSFIDKSISGYTLGGPSELTHREVVEVSEETLDTSLSYDVETIQSDGVYRIYRSIINNQ